MRIGLKQFVYKRPRKCAELHESRRVLVQSRRPIGLDACEGDSCQQHGVPFSISSPTSWCATWIDMMHLKHDCYIWLFAHPASETASRSIRSAVGTEGVGDADR
jgi:hypothetical protein